MKEEEDGDFKYIMSQPPLKWAFYIILGLLFIPVAVSRFFRGKLGQRLCAAAKKARELPFTMIDDSDKERSFVIQGIVDAVFYEEGGWVLLDYKTGGRGKREEELAAYYRPQLTWYRRAVEKLLGGQVRESWLVMLDLGKEIAVATDEK